MIAAALGGLSDNIRSFEARCGISRATAGSSSCKNYLDFYYFVPEAFGIGFGTALRDWRLSEGSI